MDGKTIALIGNPNVGKTLIFNALTGSKQHVGNWPGVTVEKKSGITKINGIKMNVIDLPGTYSLSARSLDEKIARNYIVEEKPDVVLDIVDGSNLERNLYLTFLLLELEANVVLVLNMMDIVRQNGSEIDIDKLSKKLGIPIIPTVASTGEGIEDLKQAIIKKAEFKFSGNMDFIKFPPEIESKIKKSIDILLECENLSKKYPLRWLAIKIIENDKEILTKLDQSIVNKIKGVI
ncbi:MAG: FeoB small GTPase domain-containing protein [Candidatus Helarchaeota archaeon]